MRAKQILLIHKVFYRIIFLAVFISVLGIGNLSPVHAQAWTSTHQITYFQGNKAGAISFTFDDGYTSQATTAVSELNARGLKGTFFIVTGSDWINGHVPWATWQSVAAQGHEIASHTATHPILSTISEDQINWEFSTSQSTINQNIIGQSAITIAYPFADSNNTVQSIASDYYVASRGDWADEGGHLNYYQSGVGPSGPFSAINFNNVGSMSMDGLTISDSDFNSLLDRAALFHGWFPLMFHGIPDAATFGNIIDYIQGENDYWIDTFCNISRYMKERLNSTIQLVTDTPSEIRLRIVMDVSLPVSIYNVPLTLRSTVPASWGQVIVQQGSNIQTFTPVIEGSEKVVYYNALPNGGDIVLLGQPYPVPAITSLNPVSAFAGSSAFTLTVNGNNFVAGSIVRWNNSDRATTYVSGTQLRASIPASDLASVGTANVRVFNPAPGGGVSTQLPFTIAPKPITVTVNPNQSKTYGDADPIFTYTPSDPAATFTGVLNRALGENVGVYAINQGTLTVADSNYTITSFVPANFTINIQHILTVNVVGSGSVTRNPNKTTYNNGEVVALSATPVAGWSFSSWSGACTGSGACSVTMNANKNVTATFTQNVYTLTVTPVGSGSVTRSNPGPYHLGDVVNLTPVPVAGWSFSSWSGACTGFGACSVTMDANKTVTATFTQNVYTLTVTPVGSGSVTRSNPGPYHLGDVVNLTPVPAAGWVFSNWTDACTGSGACSVTMDANKTVTATFTQTDLTPPTVLSSIPASPNPTSAVSVAFTVTFSESVTDVDTTAPFSDFTLTTSPSISGVSITGVSGTGATYTVTVNTGSGNGTIRLDVIDNDTIIDVVGSKLGGTGINNGNFSSGEFYKVHKSGGDTIGTFRQSNATFYLRNSNSAGAPNITKKFGVPGDYPVVGDWDGNGSDTLGVYRNGIFYLSNSNTTGHVDLTFAFGRAGDQPIAGDWNGDGIDTIGIYRSSAITFLLRNTNSAGAADATFKLGTIGDVGIAGDWNADGKDSTGVFRPSNGALYFKNANTTGYADIVTIYGIKNDKPVVGDWDSDGDATIGIYRSAQFYLRNTNTKGYADFHVLFGANGDMPLAGNWDGIP